MALVVEGPRKEDIDAARADVVRAQAELQATQANQLELKRREEDMLAHRADVARASAQVAITDTQINDTVVVAPIDGVVLVKSASPSATSIIPGCAPTSTRPILHASNSANPPR